MATKHSHTRLAKQLARALPNQDPNYIQEVLDGLAALPDAPRHRNYTNAELFDMFPLEQLPSPATEGKSGEGAGGEGRAAGGTPASPIQNPKSPIQNPLDALTTSNHLPQQVVQPVESERTTSNHLRDPRKKCCGTRKDGQPCNAYRLEAGNYCLFHDWDAMNAAGTEEARSRGGRHPRRRDAINLESLPIDLHDSASLLAFTEGFIRMQLAGAIPQRQCSQILRSLRIAERTLATTQGADLSRYQRLVEHFVEAAPEVAEGLDDRDVLERTNEISDIRAKREEFLAANRKFGHNQPKPVRTPSPSHPSFRMPSFHA